LVPKHLDKEWNEVEAIEEDEFLEVFFCVRKQRINDLLENCVKLNFISVGLVDAAHQTRKII